MKGTEITLKNIEAAITNNGYFKGSRKLYIEIRDTEWKAIIDANIQKSSDFFNESDKMIVYKNIQKILSSKFK